MEALPPLLKKTKNEEEGRFIYPFDLGPWGDIKQFPDRGESGGHVGVKKTH